MEKALLAPLTTFRIGGPAEFYFEAEDKDGLLAALDWAREKGLAAHYLGGGSNILVPDSGVDGLVVRLMNKGIIPRGSRLECGAGARLSDIISRAIGRNLSGLEWASGIPRATLGGAIRGNAGAFGSLMADIVETVEVFRADKGGFSVFSRQDCAFAYRQSVFKKDNSLLVWAAILRMRPEKPEAIRENIDRSFKHRKDNYPQLPSAGSVFENLDPAYVKSANTGLYNEIKGKLRPGAQVPAAILIDMLGLKGKSFGDIKVSLEHANHIVNTGQGTAEQVVMLISYIKQQVRDEFNLELREEIQYFGA